MRNLSYENEFYSQVHSNANHTHFHMKDFALGLGLKQRQKATRKWPIEHAVSEQLSGTQEHAERDTGASWDH